MSGILQPINPDSTSLFNRGKAVPVKFQLAGDEFFGFYTGDWELDRIKVNCTNFDSMDAVLEAISVTPFTVFRYDPMADQYIYNADFRDQAVGTCWKVKATLDDGVTTMTSAIFKLK